MGDNMKLKFEEDKAGSMHSGEGDGVAVHGGGRRRLRRLRGVLRRYWVAVLQFEMQGRTKRVHTTLFPAGFFLIFLW